MPDNVYLVFSKPPEEISLAAFGEWYEQHVRDILTVEGFVAARRFGFEAANGDTSPTMYSHLSLYVIEGDPHAAMERLAVAEHVDLAEAGPKVVRRLWDEVRSG